MKVLKFTIALYLICLAKLTVTAVPKLQDLGHEWNEFKLKYNKVYSSLEQELKRKQIWYKNYLYVNSFEHEQFDVKQNAFADRSIHEMVNMKRETLNPLFEKQYEPLISVPDSYDWRKYGVVGGVRDQGALGNAFLFAVEECIESLYAIQTKNLVALSIAQMQDCCGQLGEYFECIQNTTNGLCNESDYPVMVGHCDSQCERIAHIRGIRHIQSGNETDLQVSVLNGTVLVGVDASQASFQFYNNGVYSSNTCNKTEIDHAMQLVGYGQTATGVKYWIAKNSWGESWGQNGYMLIERGSNMCGIASYATLPY